MPGRDSIAIADEHKFIAAFIKVIDQIDHSTAMISTKLDKADQLHKANREVIKRLGEAEKLVLQNRMDTLFRKYRK